ncbi:vWA domain-containing protein [Herbidospora galbida]|uniref:vWA domain-containing protein n=1 Tax=Herbidospora galbida TaxID=2575442 RepID=UPI001485219E|nr:vWA domain-containing protein [Herbidospora galbida]
MTSLAFPLFGASPAAAAAEQETLPLDVVILVDESGSLREGDVIEERRAATTIARTAFNPRSRVTVLGFGSQNEVGQNAVDEVCRPTVVDSDANLQYLSTCVRELKRRTDAEGNDTDHVAALTDALSVLQSGSPDRAQKVIFLLTDGELDVPRSEAYGTGDESDPVTWARRNKAAGQQLEAQIGRLQDAGVQIWPLGFGPNVTQGNLDRFAAGGSRDSCDGRTQTQPVARIVRDPEDVGNALVTAYASATCSKSIPKPPVVVPGGETREITIDIPMIATDGTMVVNKGHSDVLVKFIDPEGKEVAGTGQADGSTFNRSGENTTTEVLRIVDPKSGPWKIQLRAPDSLAEQVVSATALWHGAVQAAIVAEPSNARTGQDVRLWLSLVTRDGAITDESALSTLDFSITASGAGLAGAQRVAVTDEGVAPDDKAHDGRYAGTFTAPQTAGQIDLVGEVVGDGIRAERVPVRLRVSPPETIIQGTVKFEHDGVVTQGQTVPGRLSMRNDTGTPRSVRLQVEGAAKATLTPGTTFDLPAGDFEQDFTVAFPADAPLGGTAVTVRLVAEDDPSMTFAEGLLTVTVERPPTTWERIRAYVFTALAVLALIAFALWQWRLAWKRRVAVKGLKVSLLLEGEPLGTELVAPSRWSDVFRFTVRDVGADHPLLAGYDAAQGDELYTAVRDGDGAVQLQVPGEERRLLPFGEESRPIPGGYRLSFRDTGKRRRSLFRRNPKAARPGVTPPYEEPGPRDPFDDTHEWAPSGHGSSHATTSTDYDDPWS